MAKHRLNIEELAVSSFETNPFEPESTDEDVVIGGSLRTCPTDPTSETFCRIGPE